MTPEQGIASLDELLNQIQDRCTGIDEECQRIKDQWEGLGRVGGRRSDAAAALLANLHFPLSRLTMFLTDIDAQIKQLVDDPFGKKKQEGGR